jgi:hypothetical protein
MQFAAFWLMFFAFALHSASRPLLWLRLSAAAAGLACGTKYQGGILLLPVLIYTGLVVRRSTPRWSLRPMAKELILNAVIFAAVFVLTTPGVILQPLIFYQSLRHIGYQYATEHYGYTVNAGAEHAYRVFCYLTCVLASHWPMVAVLFSVLACWGLAVLWKEEPLVATLFLSPALLYLLFVTSYRVMIVRNYLLVAPFMALFAARGVFQIGKTLVASAWMRRILATVFVVLFIGNVTFLWSAAQTIRYRFPPHFGSDIAEYLKKHESEKYFLSPRAAEEMAEQNATTSNTTDDPNAAQQLIVFDKEVEPAQWFSNRLGQYQLVSGPLEVNFNYYASWTGATRVLALPMQDAREMELLDEQP